MTEGPSNPFLNKKTIESEIVSNFFETYEEEKARAEAIRKLEETIKAATQRLAEIDKILKIDSLKEELALKRKKLLNSTFGKSKKREEIASLETKLDRMENPFKWSIIDRICPKNFAILFESDVRSAEIVESEVYRNNIKGIACDFFEKNDIGNKTDNAMAFSSNGFYLRFKNIKELQKKGEGVDIDGPEARYDLVNPDGLVSLGLTDLNYEEAEKALHENAQRYQAEQLDYFERTNPTDLEININRPINREELLREQAELKKTLREMNQALEELKKPTSKAEPTPPPESETPGQQGAERSSVTTPFGMELESSMSESNVVPETKIPEEKSPLSEDENEILETIRKLLKEDRTETEETSTQEEPASETLKTPEMPDTENHKNLDGFSHEQIREWYFELRNKKNRQSIKKQRRAPAEEKSEYARLRDAYENSKQKIVKDFLDNGEQEKAKEFLLKEVELKRKNDLENGSLSRKIKAGINKGITYWEEIGNNPDDSKGDRLLKKMGKTVASVAIIGGASAGIVSALSIAGVGTAAAVSGSYLGKRILTSVGFGTAISVLPSALKPFASKLALGLSAVSIAGITGYGASKLSGLATKKWLSEEAIAKKTKKMVGESEISLDSLETDLLFILEKEYEKIIKEAEKKRTYRRVLAGATALATSFAFLEVAGYRLEAEASTQQERETEQGAPPAPPKEPTPESAPETPTASSEPGIPHPAPAPEAPPATETPAPSAETETPPIPTAPEGPHEPSAEPATPAPHEIHIKADDIRVIDKGEGIEHSLIRQIEKTPGLAKELGFKQEEGAPDYEKNLEHFAGVQAHLLAIKTGYVDANDPNHQVLVGEPDKIAYEIKVEDGHPVIIEKTLDGEIIGTRHEGDPFGKSPDNKYEYEHSKPTASTTHTADASAESKITTETPPAPSAETTPEPASETPAVSETPSNFREEIYILKANEDGYDAINNLRAQMDEHYHGDYSHAPKNAQDFMNTTPSEEAVKLGLVDPAEDNKRAYPEGSILKFDDHGRLLWHNPGFEKDAEPFDTVLVDSPTENIPATHSEFFQDPNHFESEELVKVYDHNIHAIFPESFEEKWGHYQKEPIISWYSEEGDFSKADEELQPFLEYIAKLHEVTGLEPREGSIFGLLRTETVEEYVLRALRYAEEHEMLDKVKLE